jgi:RHS repeat-associated protein
MRCSGSGTGLDALRLVGDPVDVITGANTDVQRDLVVEGPLPLVWRRYYNSARAPKEYSLGWGHDHEFHRTLRFDVDGMRYEGPGGRMIAFPALLGIGDRAAAGGYTLRRMDDTAFRLTRSGEPHMWFDLRDPDRPAVLRSLTKGRDEVQFRYSVDDVLAEIVDSRGRRLAVDHDGSGRFRRIVWPAGSGGGDRVLLAYTYDARGRLVRGVGAYGKLFTFTWDDENRLIRRTDRRGYAFEFAYDRRGRCVTARGEDGAYEVHLRYEEGATVVTRGDGGDWTYEHDGRTISRIEDPYGGERVFTVDDEGRVVAEADPNGNVIAWVYNSSGELVAKRSPTGRILPPDAEGAGLATPDHKVAAHPLEWDLGEMLHPHSIQTPSDRFLQLVGVPSRVRRHLLTRSASASAISPVHVGVYDIGGRLVREEFEDGSKRRWTYDAAGNVARIVDRVGAEWRFEYTSWNHLALERDPFERAIAYRWTPRDRLAGYERVVGTAAEYVYDLKDRLIEVRRGGRIMSRYVWDAADNLLQRTDGAGNPVVDRMIGPGNRLIERTLSTGEVHRFDYDDAGRYVLLETDADSVLREYDAEGRRIAESRNGLEVAHTYEGSALRATAVLERFVTRFRWGRDGSRVVVDPTGAEHRVRHLGGGVVERTLWNGTCEVAQYDRDGRVLRRVLHRKGRIIRWRSWAYDAEGRLLEEDGDAGRVGYGYDDVGRLRQARTGGESQAFVFDEDDNLLSGPGVPEVVYGRHGRVTSLRGGGVVYDEFGRRTADLGPHGPRTLTYDSRGMLTAWTTPGEEGRAAFDPIGRRTSVERNGARTEYLWDGDRVAARIDPTGALRVFVYSGPLALTPVVFVDYDDVTADPTKGRVYAVFCEQRSAPERVEDRGGQVVWSATVEPFGRARVDPGASVELELRLPGHLYDEGTGLHYNRFRSYDPDLGRYTGPDPEGVRGGLNVYAYTTNPLVEVDVRGLHCPEHPAGNNPDCDDCQDNEVTQIRGRPPRAPDPDTVARTGNPTLVMTGHIHINPRHHEYPYRHPPTIYRVRPGEPLDVSQLDPNQRHLWAVDTEGNVWVAPEDQRSQGFDRAVKHGDLIPGDNPSSIRGEGRAGGELNYDEDRGVWKMDDNSSYSFARMDGERSNTDNLNASHDLMTQSGTDTSNIDVVDVPIK